MPGPPVRQAMTRANSLISLTSPWAPGAIRRVYAVCGICSPAGRLVSMTGSLDGQDKGEMSWSMHETMAGKWGGASELGRGTAPQRCRRGAYASSQARSAQPTAGVSINVKEGVGSIHSGRPLHTSASAALAAHPPARQLAARRPR